MIKILELFGGIGACTKAFERLGIPHEVVDYVEIDKYAVKSFNAVHGTNFEPQDITKWDKDIEVDFVMHGSPCQDFSIAGLQAGGDKDSGTRSSLMYETLRIVKKLQPKYVVWENVKNLLSKKHRHNFDAYIEAMSELGYVSKYQILNAKDYGIPQNRERVFTVSVRTDGNSDEYDAFEQDFHFPVKQPLEKKLKDVLEDSVDEKYYISDAMMNYFMGVNQKESKFPRKERFLANINRKDQDRANSITTNAGNRPTDNFVKEPMGVIEYRTRNQRIIDTAEKSGFKNGETVYLDVYNRTPRTDVTSTLNAGMDSHQNNIIGDNFRVRKLTPKECWRLMGFDDEDFEKAEKVNSNTQLYKQAGNSIVVNVLEGIIGNLLKGGKNDNK